MESVQISVAILMELAENRRIRNPEGDQTRPIGDCNSGSSGLYSNHSVVKSDYGMGRLLTSHAIPKEHQQDPEKD